MRVPLSRSPRRVRRTRTVYHPWLPSESWLLPSLPGNHSEHDSLSIRSSSSSMRIIASIMVVQSPPMKASALVKMASLNASLNCCIIALSLCNSSDIENVAEPVRGTSPGSAHQPIWVYRLM